MKKEEKKKDKYCICVVPWSATTLNSMEKLTKKDGEDNTCKINYLTLTFFEVWSLNH